MKARHIIGGLALMGIGAAMAILATGKQEKPQTAEGDAIFLDLDGDGVPDIILEDLNGDTKIDTVIADTTGDGKMDTILKDLNGDGNVNVIVTDNPELLGKVPDETEVAE